MNLGEAISILTHGYTDSIAFSLGGLKPNLDPTRLGFDDQCDAFRHAYASAKATERLAGGDLTAKRIGDWNENRIPAPTNPVALSRYLASRNMDLWNSNDGR